MGTPVSSMLPLTHHLDTLSFHWHLLTLFGNITLMSLSHLRTWAVAIQHRHTLSLMDSHTQIPGPSWVTVSYTYAGHCAPFGSFGKLPRCHFNLSWTPPPCLTRNMVLRALLASASPDALLIAPDSLASRGARSHSFPARRDPSPSLQPHA